MKASDTRQTKDTQKYFANVEIRASKRCRHPRNSDQTARNEEDQQLDHAEVRPYRACAARCNFLGLDRPDVQYAAKEVSRAMSNPHQSDVVNMKRLGRYLHKHPRAIFMFKFQAPQDHIRIYSDTNWAECIKTRKSIQGGAVMLGQHCVKTCLLYTSDAADE